MCKKILGLLLAIVLLTGVVFGSVFAVAAGSEDGQNAAVRAGSVQIVQQPKSASAASGDSLTVRVVASGEGLTYKWYYKNPGAEKFKSTSTFTGDTYTISSMDAARDGRQVYCVITDKYGNKVTTETVTLRLGAPVKITQQPQSAAGFDAERVTVTVKATGEGLTYQWYFKEATGKNFALTTTYTTNTYSVPMKASRDGRQVYCVITDKYGNSVTTDTVTLSMKYAVKIEKQPTSAATTEGKKVTVSFTASGDGLTYKWYYKNPGSSTFKYTSSFSGSKYFVEMSAERNGRQVYCVVTDKYGNSVTTDTVTISMAKAVQITQQPQSVGGFAGETLKVSVAATGDGLTYKWYYKNPGEAKFFLTKTFTGNTYTVSSMSASRDGRQIYCVITDQYGNSVTTDTVTLSLKRAVKIEKQPTSVSVLNGDKAVVSFTASGDGLTYKWYFKNPGEAKFSLTKTFTGNTYTVSSMSASRDGRQIYCVITDKYGNSVTTETVTLSMYTTVSITKQPVSVTVLEGSKATVTVGAVGDGLTYQWYFKNADGKDFALTTSFTTSKYTVTVTAARAGRQVYCVITDKYGNSVQTDVVTFNMIHVHKLGQWVTLREPTPEREGLERADCSGCDYYEEREIAKIPAVYYITIDLGNGQIHKIGVGSNGVYELPDPERIGFNFMGFVDSQGNPFASSGKVAENISIAAAWEIDGTDTLEELLERAEKGATEILITGDIVVDRPIFVPYVTTIYADGDFSIIRDPGYDGDIFVVGTNSKGESSVVNHHQAVLNLGGGKGTLTIDGNCSNMIITVKGSLVFAGDSCVVNIYDGVRLANNVKLGNKRALNYGSKTTGGAAIVNFNSTVRMYGGVIDNCAVATEHTQVFNSDGSVSNYENNGCGGAVYNRGNFYMYGGLITNCEALRGGAIYNDRYIFLDAGTISYSKAYTYGGAVSSSSSANADTHFGNTDGQGKMRFIGNHSVRAGGAFYSNTNSPLVIYGNTEFIDNHSDSSGGAIYTGGALTIRGTYFSGNYCAYSGGAIYHHFANADRVRRFLSIEDSVFENNTGSLGGAVILSSNVTESGTYATIKNCEFIGNHAVKNEHNAGNGGALYITRYSEAIITGCTFTNNDATTNSGAVSVHSNSKLNMTDCTFTGNTAQFGGAMYISSDAQATLKNVEYIGNKAIMNENGGGGNGGALYLANVDISIQNIVLRNNSAANNAGAVYLQNIDLEVGSDWTIEGNSAGAHGGVFYLTYVTNADGTKDGSRLEVHDVTIKNNFALAGGVISARTASEVILNNVDFVGNSTPDAKVSTGNGGGVIYSNNSTITVQDVTFDGNMSGYYGGVLRLDYCETAINNSTFKNNAGGTGGAVYVSGGSLTMTGGSFTDNVSTLNGVIYVNATSVTLTNVTASGNQAPYGGVLNTSGKTQVTVTNCNWSGNSASNGGAIYVAGNSTVTVTGSKFENNTARSQGGAIYVVGTNLQVGADTVFTGNTSASNGGAICAIDLVNETTGAKKGANVTVTGVTFTGNTGACGGAVYFNDSTYVITDCEFVGNTATSTSYGGGAIYNTGATGEIERVILKNNTALRGGAVALYTNSSMTARDVKAIGNTATADGGAFYSNNCELRLLDEVVLNENTAYNGGALYLHNRGIQLENVILQDNAALNNGGAVYITGATLEITGADTVISGNTAVNYGGVIYGSYVTVEGEKNGATINITGVTLSENSALYGGAIAGRTNTVINLTNVKLKDNNTDAATQDNEAGGGAIYANNSVITLSGCELTGNSSGYYGGVIKTDACEVILKDGTRFEGNSGGTGAVLYLSSGSSLNATDLEVVNNTSLTNGILYLNGKDFVFDGLTATGNSAAWNGGVLYINGGKTKVTISGSLLKDNTAGSGGAAYIVAGHLQLTNTRLEDNSAGKGGAIYASAGDILLDGMTVLTGNSASDGGAIYAMDKAQVTVNGITVQNNTATGNGGAIYIRGAKLTICGNATFTGNSAATGGALNINDYLYLANPNDLEQTRVEGFAEITDAVFSNNTAGRGGAVYVNNVEYTVTNAEFSDNIATAVDYGGGAIYSTVSIGQLKNVTFTGNSSVKGGAVALHTDSVMNIDSVTATGNSAVANADGGYGVGGVFYVNNADLIITDSDGLSVLGEEGKGNAAVSGGVIQAENGAVVNLANVQIEGNSSSQNGGAIYAGNSQVTINGVSFESNTAGLAGGAIYVSKSKITVGGVTFNTNSATVTGGAVYLNASELTNTGDVTFTENTAAEHGGAIYATYSGKDADRVGSVINMTGGSFSGNKAMAGGAVSIRTGCSATFDGTVFAGNSVTGYADKNDGDGDGGGAIYMGFGELTLKNVSLSNNTAEGYGGAIAAVAGTVNISGSTITGNTAMSGGAINARSGCALTITQSQLNDNVSTHENLEYDNTIGGGAVSISGGSLTIGGTSFSGNKSSGYGGALLASGTTVTINGQSAFTKSESGTGAALHFKGGCNVTLENITVTENTATRNGAIYANGSTVVMTGVSATKNKAGSGGVLYISGASTNVTATNCNFTENSAKNGGVAFAENAKLTFDTCTFTDNDATNGGSVYIKGATLIMDNCDVTGAAVTKGGVVYAEGGNVQLDDVNFSDNTAANAGAVYATDATVTITGGSFGSNCATGSAGAIYTEGGALNITGANFAGNATGVNGGAIYTLETEVVMSGVTFERNTAAGNGGAVDVAGSNVTITDDCIFRENTAANGYGGAIYVVYANGENNEKLGTVLNMTGGSFVDNSALSGGAIAGRTNSVITLTGVVMDGNASTFVQDSSAYDSSKGGGAIFCNNSQLTLSGCELTGNSSAYYGGAIKVMESDVTVKDDTVISGSTGATGAALHIMGSLNVDGLILTNNTSSANGVIYLNGAQMNISGLTATGNSAKWNGGVLYISGGKTNVTVTDSSFEGNTAPSGGAVWIGGGTLTMNGVNLVSNTATNGGAIHAVAGTVTLDGCTVSKNTATKEGGAVYSTGAVINTVNGSFAENTAGNGGAIYIESAALSVNGTTFTNNAASNGGAVMLRNEASAEITGANFADNTATSGGAVNVSGATLTILEGVTFTENSATGNGGAVWVGDYTYKENEEDTDSITVESSMSITGAAFERNTAAQGGAIYGNSTEYAVTDTRFVDNTATNENYGGGAIYTTSSIGQLENVTFTGNSSVKGGAVALHTNSQMTVTSMTATGNSAVKNQANEMGLGGVFFVNNSTLNLNGTDGSIVIGTADNGNSAASGGAIRAENKAVLTINGAVFTGNSSSGSGGAVYATGVNVAVNNSAFEGNTAVTHGGAMYVSSGNLSGEKNTFKSNSAGNQGGAIMLGCTFSGTERLGGVFNMNDSTFDSNSSGTHGGAIYLHGIDATGSNLVFVDNEAPQHGGAIYANYVTSGDNRSNTILSLTGGKFEGNSAMAGGAISARTKCTVTLDGTSLIGNSVSGYDNKNDGDSDGGGAIYVGFGEVTLKNVTATGNVAESYGGVVDAYNATVNIIGGTYENNSAALGGGVIYAPSNSVVDIENATFTGNKTTDQTVQNTVGGGVVQIVKGTLTISGATFTGNSSGYYGGVLLAGNTKVTINGNTTITGSTGSTGTALYFKDSCTVNMENVTLNGNTGKGKANGVIYANSGTLTLKNISASGNKTYNGGVLYISGGTTSVENSVFTSNNATNTGGVVHLANAKFFVTGGSMSSNTAAHGGAIYNINGTVETSGTVFENNTATGELGGGAIAVDGGSVKLSAGTTFTGNTATGNGGAIYATATDPEKLIVEIDGAVFEENTAVQGGAVYSLGAKVNTQGGNFTANEAGEGGAVYIESAALTVNGTTFTNNAASNGGAVMLCNEASAEITGANFADNTATSGGAVNVSGATLTILEGTTFTENSATGNGGAVWVGNYTYKENEEDTESVTVKSDLTVDGASFTGNTAAQGGAIYVNGNTYTVKNTQFTNNSATSQTHGGGAVYTTSSTGTMEGVTLTGNTSHRGGAVALHTNSVLTVTSLTATGNSATRTDDGKLGVGGVFFVGGATLNLNGTDGSIVIGTADNGNSAASSGAIRAENNAVLNISGATFTDNASAGSGGAVYATGANVAVNNSAFEGNTALYGGGAIFVQEKTFTMNGNTFVGNSASNNGGAVYCDRSTVEMNGNTFTENETAINGGALNLLGCTVNGENNVFTDNKAVNHGGAIYVVYHDLVNSDNSKTRTPTVATLTGGKFEGNTAMGGGAISIRSACSMHLVGTSLIENSVTGYSGENDGDGEGGGAIYVGFSSVTLENITATGNIAESYGGVVDAYQANVTVIDGSYTGNTATIGGVIYALNSSNVSITGTIVKDNEASSGGAFNIAGGSNLTLTNATITGNKSTYVQGATYDSTKGGGAVYISGGKLIVTGTTFDGNESGYYGGAVLANGTTVTIGGNSVVRNSKGGTGGALHFRGNCTTTIEDTQILNNTASLNGVVYSAGGKLTMTDVTASGNKAVSGGVLYNSASVATITECTFTGNNATNGGAIDHRGSNMVTVVDSVISNNTSKFGAIYLAGSANLTVKSSEFNGNTATGKGGAIYHIGTGLLSVSEDTLFVGNTAPTGGAIYLDQGAKAEISNSTFTENNSTGHGGAISVEDSTTDGTAATSLTMSGVVFNGNSATGRGGALATDENSPNLVIKATDCTFTANTSGSGGGAVVVMNKNRPDATEPTEANIVFTNCTFTENVGGSSGGAIEIRSSSYMKLDGITATNNETKGSGAVVYVTSDYSRLYLTGTVTISGNKVGANQAGTFAYLYKVATYNQAPSIYTTHSSNAAWCSEVKGNTAGIVYDLAKLP